MDGTPDRSNTILATGQLPRRLATRRLRRIGLRISGKIDAQSKPPPSGRGHSFQATAKALRDPRIIRAPYSRSRPSPLLYNLLWGYLLHLLQTIGLESAAPPPVGWRNTLLIWKDQYGHVRANDQGLTVLRREARTRLPHWALSPLSAAAETPMLAGLRQGLSELDRWREVHPLGGLGQLV